MKGKRGKWLQKGPSMGKAERAKKGKSDAMGAREKGEEGRGANFSLKAGNLEKEPRKNQGRKRKSFTH